MQLSGTPLRAGQAVGRTRLEPTSGVPDSNPIIAAYRMLPMNSPFLGAGSPWGGLLIETQIPRLPSDGPPAVGGIRLDWLRDGDRVELDGAQGTIELPEVRRTPVVTVFLEAPDGRILLLKRSERVGSFQGHWAGVSGFMEGGPALEDAFREVREETGIEAGALSVASNGPPLLARGGDRMYEIHPFRLRTSRTDVRIDWEHTEFEWTLPEAIRSRPTVPQLWEAWTEVRSPSDPAGTAPEE